MPNHRGRLVLRVRRFMVLALVFTLAADGLLLYLAEDRADSVQAQALTQVNTVRELSQGAGRGFQGRYQQQDYDGSYYNLWQYRDDGIHLRRNQCDAKDDGNERPRELLIWNNLDRKSEVFNDVVYWEPDGRWHSDPIYGPWFEETGYKNVEYCRDRNATPFGNNLKYDPTFPTEQPHYTRATGAPRTPSAHDWNTTGLTNATALEAMDTFYAIGITNYRGLQSPELELNLWLPKKDINGILEIAVSEFCTHNSWDSGSDLTSTLLIEIEGSKATSQYDCNAISNKVTISNIKQTLGDPLNEKPFITDVGGSPQETLYARYLLRAKTTATTGGYTNQFRLNVTTPSSGYLGIAKTKITGQPENALGVGMRLPGGSLQFRRLKILWEMNIYVAIDPAEGCQSSKKAGEFGLYDTDHPPAGSTSWIYNYPPSLQIYQTDRNEFLDGKPPNWSKDIDGDGTVSNEEGKYTFEDSTQNIWDTNTFGEFEGDKIYRFHFYNLNQRSWMQIGIPFDQVNSLQKCVEKPLVKVYYGDVSVGGHFGTSTTSRACDQAASGTANIYGQWVPNKETDTSSAEYAVYVRGEIMHFYSGYKRGTDPPDPHNKLTFANDGGDWGQAWSQQLRCMPNWWRQTNQLGNPLTDASLDLDPAIRTESDLEQFYEPTGGVLSLKTGNVADLDLKATIYVKGDLLITEDIINLNENLEKLNQIKTIYLIVQGDIFIEPDVAQIDAVLIAMPTDHPIGQTQDGRIFTCYIPNVTDDPSIDLHSYDEILEKTDAERTAQNVEYSDQCNNEKLIINGAVAARQIRFGRMTDPNDDDFVREEINFLPEYFVGISLLPSHTDWYYRPDSITILPINF